MSGIRIGSLGVKPSRAVALAVWSAVLVLMVLALASCAKPPEAEMTAADLDLSRAKDAEAPIYAPEEYRAAADSLAAARNEVDRQKAKFALFRSYGAAKQKAIAAGEAAKRAAESAVANKEQMRKDAEKTLAEVQQAIAGVREKLDSPMGKKLARAKEQRQAIEQIRAELDAREAALQDIQQAQAQEKYIDALRMAGEALGQVKKLDEEILTAIAKLTGGS